MRFIVKGANQDNGKEITILVEAPNQAAAAQEAREHGIYVSSISYEAEEPIVQSSEVEPAYWQSDSALAEAARAAQTARRVPTPTQEQLVWRGNMGCSSCGYQWKARRNTPPAKCPSCARRTAVPAMEKAGCLIFMAYLLTGVLGILALCAALLFT
jgi:rubrerythrin